MKNPIVINARFLNEDIRGVGRVALELSKELKTIIPEITFLAPPTNKNKKWNNILEVKHIGNFKGFLWEQLEFPFYVQRNYKNAIVINLANTAPIFFKHNITYIHDIIWRTNPNWYTKKAILYYFTIMPFVIQNAKQILTNSKFTRSELTKNFPSSKFKINVVPCGIRKFAIPDKDFTEKIRQKFGKYILAVSSLDPRKNFERLIKAYLLLNRADINLVIVGEKHKTFPAINLSAANNNQSIHFTGFINDECLAALYENAYVFIYPTLKEGFGIPPLEAMTYGCPVITSNTSSIPEVCGEAVLYINPLDVQDIVMKIELILNDTSLRLNLIKMGYERIKIFNWEKSAKIIKDLLNL